MPQDLSQARALGGKISVDELQQAYRLHEHRIRNDLYLALTLEDPETGNRLPLPPQFFYGVSNWKQSRPLDQVAIEVSNPIEAYRLTIDEIPPNLTCHLWLKRALSRFSTSSTIPLSTRIFFKRLNCGKETGLTCAARRQVRSVRCTSAPEVRGKWKAI